MYDSGSPRRGSFGTKSQGGNGAPRLGIYQPPPPFFGLWTRDSIGMEKKNRKRAAGYYIEHRTVAFYEQLTVAFYEHLAVPFYEHLTVVF